MTRKAFYERALEAEERAERAEQRLAALERVVMADEDWKRRAVKFRTALQGIVDSDLSAEGMRSAARTILAADGPRRDSGRLVFSPSRNAFLWEEET